MIELKAKSENFVPKTVLEELLAKVEAGDDFNRKMCDLFETSYHLDSFDLVKLFAEKLKIDYLL